MATETSPASARPAPRLAADLLLVHPPAFFDFRAREDIYFPYLSTSGDVPITPLYEHFPLGFKTLQRWLGERGHSVEIVNLATLMLKHPEADVRALFEAMEVGLVGIDLHWMVHVQGSLAVAALIKAIHPETRIVFGGISATYYAAELIRYPMIDMVMRGYDTHAPMAALMASPRGELRHVENLLWKDRRGEVVDNGFTHTPDAFSCGTDWSTLPPRTPGLPMLEVMSTQNAGCAYNCNWCGGSRDAFRRINGRKLAMARKPAAEVAYEFGSLRAVEDRRHYHFYSVGTYNETRPRLRSFFEQVEAAGLKSISYEQFHLTPDDDLRAMAKASPRTTITLSPESHDPRIAKLAGRGVYGTAEMETWIERALDLGIHGIDVWFFIGMEEQTEASVWETVDYCERLLERFAGRRVVPMLCPMIPFLDPASTFFEEPDRHGYRIFHRSVEEHRRGMERASLIHRINYETRWLSRSDLVHVGYRAVRRLVEAKHGMGMLPRFVAKSVTTRIDDALGMIDVVHAIDSIESGAERARELAKVGAEILRRNDAVFFGGVSNQAFPMSRPIGGRWFDEVPFEPVEQSPHELRLTPPRP